MGIYLTNDRLSKNITIIEYFVSFFLPIQNNLKNKIENEKLK